jgi:dihydroorotase
MRKLEGFDTRFKLLLHYAWKRIEALLKELLDNTIDMITSDHNNGYRIRKEFDMAKDGTIGLESAFCTLMTVYH